LRISPAKKVVYENATCHPNILIAATTLLFIFNCEKVTAFDIKLRVSLSNKIEEIRQKCAGKLFDNQKRI